MPGRFITRPSSLTLLRVVRRFEVLDTPTGPVSLLPGDVVLLDDASRQQVPVRRST